MNSIENREFCLSDQFLKDSELVALKTKSNFTASYLSLNVSINQTAEFFSYIKSERRKFSKFEPEILELYKNGSLHFTLGAAVQLLNDPNAENIKKIVEPQKEDILKIVREEISKIKSFKVAAKFTKATEQSIFVFCSFEKEMEKTIENFQNNIVERIYKVLEDTGVEKYTGNKPFGRPVNFARWNVTKLPEDVKGFFEHYTKSFTEEIKTEGKVRKAVLTYSDQSWSNPERDTIRTFELK